MKWAVTEIICLGLLGILYLVTWNRLVLFALAFSAAFTLATLLFTEWLEKFYRK